MQWNLSTAADVIGVLGAILGTISAYLAWRNTIRIRNHQKSEQDRLSQKVKLVLKAKDTGDFIELPGEMRRAEMTRAEVLGWVGMLPMKEKPNRFQIAYTNSADFLSQLSEVQTGDGKVTFVIQCTEGELNQFDVQIVKPKKREEAENNQSTAN